MAGDWIKMRGSLCTHPKVLRIAAIIGKSDELGRRLSLLSSECLDKLVTRDVTRDVTLASLLRIWCAVNEHTNDGVMSNCSLSTIDDITGIPSFGDAMASVGWAVYDEKHKSVTFPNFLENNVPAKDNARSTNAERQARYREKQRLLHEKSNSNSNGNGDVTRDVTVSVISNAREEKRREDVNTTNPDGLVVASDAGNLPGIPAEPETTEPEKPGCPHQQIIALYHEILPMCPRIRDWTPARAAMLRARWNEDAKRQNLLFWRRLFEYIKACSFLVGQVSGRGDKPFFADLPWIAKAENFAKIREGRYENRSAA